MVLLVPKSNKKKTKEEEEEAQAPCMLRLCHGVHLHQKQQNQEIKRGGGRSSLSINTW
jgi:hypothetical protein